MRVSAPSDRRFRRAHASPARRRSSRLGWLRLARLIGAVVLGLGGVYYAADRALSAEALKVSSIEVSGNSRMARGEVLALLDGLRGRSILTIDLEAWRERLLGAPWVLDATMRRVFPDAVSVVISERQPMGIARIGDRLYLVDPGGTIIDEFGPNSAGLDLPIIDGLDGARPSGLLVDEARARLVGRMLADLERRPDLSERVSQVDVSDARNIVLALDRDTVLVALGEERFVERLQSYLDLAPALKERVPAIDYVDLRFDERVYVRPRSASPPSRRRSGR
jgi:cell division protein FtsQ